MWGTPFPATVLIILNWRFCEGMDMDTGMERLILAAALVIAIGIGGTVMSHAGDVGKTAPNPSWNTPASSRPSQHPQAAANLSKDDIRQAQLELRHSGLYNGSLDGVIGPQTKQALVQFQKDNGLEPTAALDPHTMVTMFGNIGTSQGSSMPPNAAQGTGQWRVPKPGHLGATVRAATPRLSGKLKHAVDCPQTHAASLVGIRTPFGAAVEDGNFETASEPGDDKPAW
jgi:peptidoglycan hydrolase-like protein with peptidoglycan-binding domain